MRLMLPAADATAELVELRQSESLRTLDDHNRRVGNIHADFDYGSGNQNIILFILEIFHYFFFVFRFHPAVKKTNLEFRKYFFGKISVLFRRGFPRNFFRFLNERENEKGLPAGFYFGANKIINP